MRDAKLAPFDHTGVVVLNPAGDEAVVSVLTELADSGPQGWGTPYTVNVVGVRGHCVDVAIRQGVATARVWLALPSSRRPMPWMQFSAPDADGWVRDLLNWLNEEIDTGGITARATHTDSDGVSRLVVEGYGLQVDDPAEHQRLLSVVGPNGWGQERGRREIRRQCALEWALDQVEQQIKQTSEAPRDRSSAQRSWPLVSPTGLAVLVEAAAVDDSHREFDLRATTGGRWSHQTAARRLKSE